LSNEFVNYLLEDGIYLPTRNNQSEEQNNDEQPVETTNLMEFSELAQIENVLKEIGTDGVFVKLNWSCPLDAVWVFGGSLRCLNSNEILMLLKSSDRIVFDIEHMFDLCPAPSEPGVVPRRSADSHHLVIRKWANLLPSMEFRVFVRGGKIVGMSQRDCCTYYPFLGSEEEKDRIEELICSFFSAKVKKTFPLPSCNRLLPLPLQ
jgi:hypothetical protein